MGSAEASRIGRDVAAEARLEYYFEYAGGVGTAAAGA